MLLGAGELGVVVIVVQELQLEIDRHLSPAGDLCLNLAPD